MKRNNCKFFATAVLFAVVGIRLPYQAGQSFVAVEAYNAPPTHIKKDLYAIDFSQNNCDAYGKPVVAATAGKIMLAQENGYNGGYGTQVLVDDGNTITRYAHLIPDTIPVIGVGGAVAQGQQLGAVGNTGLVMGLACPEHPGTHVHFAMYTRSPVDGTYLPVLPEPISGYTHISAGKWYLSDNAPEAAEVNAGTSVSSGTGLVLGAFTAEIGTSTASSTLAVAMGTGGGVSVSPLGSQSNFSAPESPPAQPATDTVIVAPTTTIAITPAASATFNSSTFVIDLAWLPAAAASDTPSGTVMYQVFSSSTFIATTTATSFSYQISNGDFGTTLQFAIVALLGDASTTTAISTIAAAPVLLPDWWRALQPVDTENSAGSWYDDNWYNLGTGFYGTIKSLTLEGFVSDSHYFASHLWLDEFLDANYSNFTQEWTISDDAPFTNGLRKVTIGGLNISLQPNKYYRLRTYQDYQNRSVILTGTSATGTAMYDKYIYDVGGVNVQYQFYPYLAAIMIPNYPPQASPGPPAGMAISFNQSNSSININWQAATDPDTISKLLTYQINIGTSTTPDDAKWILMGKSFSVGAAVASGTTYTIGVRAVDDFGNIGPPLIEPWNYPTSTVFLPPLN